MKIERIDWDSDFFNFEIGKIFNESTVNSSVDGYQLLISNEESQEVILGFTNSFSEVKIIFNKVLKQNLQFRILKNLIVDADLIKFDVNEVYNLAYESGKFSRFFLDKNFGKNKFKQLYRVWVDNSINKKVADKIFFILDRDKIVGFITFKIDLKIATVGLVAVLPSYQGLGIGRELVFSVENYCLKNKITEINIPTQLINEAAVCFYKKIGYSVVKRINIKHFWKNDSIQ